MTRSSMWCAVLCAVAFLMAGCATIPGETMPQRADLQGGGNVTAGIAEPPKSEDPFGIVRGFVDNNADPTNLHAAARGYLVKSAQTTWDPNDSSGPSVSIIADTFSTASGVNDTSDPNLYNVILHTTLVGSLGIDGSFQPPGPTQTGDYQVSVQLKRSDGQWRIINPPNSLVITQSDFTKYYRPVSVYFFSPSWAKLVPDQRYVVSDPISGLPGRIMQSLLDGPSASLKGAVLNAIPTDATLKTNVTELSNGEINVNLSAMPDQQSSTKQLMIAQIVRSLQNYGSSVAVESEGVSLVQGHLIWGPADLSMYTPYVGPSATSLVVAHNRIYNLSDGKPIAGPAGNGDYDVVTAAQSMDGQELATVTRTSNGSEELRIGAFKGTEEAVKDLAASQFTRPTWEPGDTTDPSRAVWTVADGVVVRVVSTPQGNWAASPVDTSAVTPFGDITDLRLSRDGVRVAIAVTGGRLLVGAVVSDQGSVSIKQVQQVQPTLAGVTKVDWLRQDQIVVATSSLDQPVLSVSVDGEKIDPYSSANLTSTVTALAASQTGPVLAVDSAGMWSSTDINEVWTPVQPNQPAGAIPFYPG